MEQQINWTLLTVIVLAIAFTIYWIFDYVDGKLKDRDKRISEYAATIAANNITISNQKLEFDKFKAEAKFHSQQWALEEFEKYKANEFVQVKKNIEENAIEAATNLLQEWKIEKESEIRKDAILRSYSVNLGKITEHLVPFHAQFPFNPRDARFIGSPIDLMVFDGHSVEADRITIYFIEIKTGKSRLSQKQQKIKLAVQNREVVWLEINSEDLIGVNIIS